MKQTVDAFKEKTKSTQKIDSIDDMKKFVQDYPAFRELSGNVEKHVGLVSGEWCYGQLMACAH